MNISISLPAELLVFVRTKVESGRYTSTSEVVREALRLLERSERREAEVVDQLRRAWEEGIAGGDGGPLDAEALKQEGRRRLAKRS